MGSAAILSRLVGFARCGGLDHSRPGRYGAGMAVILDPTVLVREAHELLARFVDPATLAQRDQMMRALAPQVDDFAKVFMPESVDAAREGFTTLWAAAPQIVAKAGQIHVL